MTVPFLQHIVHGAVGTPGLASIVEVGVPPSICHLPPARGVRGASHATCLVILLLVIQTEWYLGSPDRMDEVQPGKWMTSVVGNWTFFSPICWSKVEDTTLDMVLTTGNFQSCR